MRSRSTSCTERACTATVVVTALLMIGVSACGGESTVECTGGAYEAECHPVAPPAHSTADTAFPTPALTPSRPCPSDRAEFYKAVHNRTLDWACPPPTFLNPPPRTAAPLPSP